VRTLLLGTGYFAAVGAGVLLLLFIVVAAPGPCPQPGWGLAVGGVVLAVVAVACFAALGGGEGV
jgi:hypothetical protein